MFVVRRILRLCVDVEKAGPAIDVRDVLRGSSVTGCGIPVVTKMFFHHVLRALKFVAIDSTRVHPFSAHELFPSSQIVCRPARVRAGFALKGLVQRRATATAARRRAADAFSRGIGYRRGGGCDEGCRSMRWEWPSASSARVSCKGFLGGRCTPCQRLEHLAPAQMHERGG